MMGWSHGASEMGRNVFGECGQFCVVGFPSAMGAQRHAFIDRDDVEMWKKL